METRIPACHADYEIHAFPIRVAETFKFIFNLWLYHTGMPSSLHTLKAMNSFFTWKNFPGKWRIERFLLSLIRLSPDYYHHPFGFWWLIEDESTKGTFLANCENSTSSLIRKISGTTKIVFIDIGSNRGWYSLLATSLNSNSEVFAFEPVDSVRQKLKENLKRNGYGNTRVFSCALGADSHTTQIWSYSGNDGMHTLYPIEEWSAQSGHEVTVETLNQYTKLILDLDLPILVKIDVEGSEMDVLQGGTNLLRQGNLQIIIEINETMLLAGNSSAEEIFAFLKSFGFSGFWISPDSMLVAQNEEIPLPHRGKLPALEGANYFFTKKPEAMAVGVLVR